MKICIFGGDGKTGIEVVNYAKSRGFEVVAFVYSEESNKYFVDGIEIKKGNAIDYNGVIEAMRGSDLVVSTIGHIKGSDSFVQTKAIVNVIKAMKELGIRRVLSLTGTGVRVEGDKPSIIDRILNFLVAFVDPERVNDGKEHVKALRSSGLDWTVVRVLKLNKNEREIDKYELTDGGPAELQTSRKKVAKILIDLIGDKKYIGKLPVVSG